VNFGELSGPLPAVNMHQLFRESLFVTKYNGMHWLEGVYEIPSLISDALTLASKRRAVISDVAGRFALSYAVDAYRELESNAHGKVLVLPGL